MGQSPQSQRQKAIQAQKEPKWKAKMELEM